MTAEAVDQFVFQTDLFSVLPNGQDANFLLSAAETCLAAGKFAEAELYAKDAVRQAPSEKKIILGAANIFAAIGQLALASDCYQQLYALSIAEPEDLARHAAFLGQLAQYEKSALKYIEAMRNSSVGSPHADHAADASSAFIQAGMSQRAALVMLAQRKDRNSNDVTYWLYTISALKSAGRTGIATKLAEILVINHSDNADSRYMLAALYAESRFFNKAMEVLNFENAENHYNSSKLYSAILNDLGDYDRALFYINSNINNFGAQSSDLFIRASIYGNKQMFAEASDDYASILATDSENVDAKRGAFLTMTEAGRYADAIPIGAALVAEFPDDADIRQTLQIVMERSVAQSRIQAVSKENVSQTLVRRFGLPPKVDRSHKLGMNPHPLILQWRVILALLLRETRTRFGKSRLGYLWVIFEPLAHIGIMITLISVLGHSRTPPIGDSFAMFYFTGIIPFHMFTHTVGHLMHSVPENRPLLQLPRVKPMDVYMARGILELLTEVCVSILLLMGFMFFGFNIVPLNPFGVFSAFLLIWMCGFGVGLISAVLARFFSAWPRIWGALTSILYFASGTFYIPRMMPESIRDILSWSPTLQAIEMVRVNYFIEPYPYWLDVSYLAGFAIVSMAVGLLLERLYRNRILEAE